MEYLGYGQFNSAQEIQLNYTNWKKYDKTSQISSPPLLVAPKAMTLPSLPGYATGAALCTCIVYTCYVDTSGIYMYAVIAVYMYLGHFAQSLQLS